MALTDLGIFSDVEDDEAQIAQPESAPRAAAPGPVVLPKRRPDTSPAAAPVTPPGNDLGMFSDIEDEPEADPFAGESWDATVQRRAQQVVKGGTEAFATVPEAVELALRGVQNQLGIEGEDNIRDTAGFKMARDMRAGVEGFVGKPDPRDDSFWAQVAQGAGNMAGMAVAAGTAGLLTGGTGALLVGGAQGMAMNAQQQYEEAIAAGANEDVALQAAGLGALVGSAEVLPLTRALKIIPPKYRGEVGNLFFDRLLHTAKSSGEEAAQEYVAQVANNLIAKGFYDPTRGWDEGALEAGLVGGVLGGGTGAIGSFNEKRAPAAAVEDITVTGPSQEQAEALATASDPSVVGESASDPIEPEIAAAVETQESPADRAKRISRERARRVLEQQRAMAEPVAESVAEPGVTVGPEIAETVTPAAPVPGADTALAEDLPPPQLAEVIPEVSPEVTTQSNPEVAPEETIPTVPESPETIEAQRGALQAGTRMAVLYPWGTSIPTEFTGTRIRRAHIPSLGIIDYDSRKISGADLRALIKFGKLNEVLGLGPANKADVAQSAAAGSPEVAVTERQPDGTEVKAAAGTVETAPAQVEALTQMVAQPENTVQVETPEAVIQDRVAAEPVQAPVTPEVAEVAPAEEPQPSATAVAAPRYLEAKLTPEEQARLDEARAEDEKRLAGNLATIKRDEKAKAKEERVENRSTVADEVRAKAKAKGYGSAAEEALDRLRKLGSSNLTKAEKNAIAARAEIAAQTVSKMAPSRDTAITTSVEAKAYATELRKALEYAEGELKVAVPQDQKRDRKLARYLSIPNLNSRVGFDTNTDAVVWLAEAVRIFTKAGNERLNAEDFAQINNFIADTIAMKNGDGAPLRERRKLEGDAATFKGGGSADVEQIAAAPVTTESNEEPSDGVVPEAAVTPAIDAEDVQTKTTKSARSGVRGVSASVEERVVKTKKGGTEVVEGAQAASGDKLSAEDKKRLIEAMNRQLAERANVVPNSPEGWSQVDGGAFAELASMRHGKKSYDEQLQEASEMNFIGSGTDMKLGEWLRQPIEQQVGIETTEAKYLSDVLMDWVSRQPESNPAKNVMKQFAPMMLRRIREHIPDLKVTTISDDLFTAIMRGRPALAYYAPDTDVIAIRESVPAEDIAHVFMHEAAHALFYHRMKMDTKLRQQVDELRKFVKNMMYRREGGLDAHYGFTNADEFMSEAFSNPEFQGILAQTPVDAGFWRQTMPEPASPVLRNVLNWIKKKIFDIVGGREWFAFNKAEAGDMSALEVAFGFGGYLLETADGSRDLFYRRAMADDLAAVEPLLMEEAPKSVRDKLVAAGVPDLEADAIEELIRDEFGGSVSDDELAALAAEFAKPVTSESDLEAKVAATPPPGKPAVRDLTKGEDFSKPSATRAFFLKTMTLDFMRQKYGKLFIGKDGTRHLDNFISWLQRRDNIVKRVSDPHNRDAADYVEYSRKDPANATALAELAMDATRFDVRLGAGADNSHLGQNAKRGLQAKAALAGLNARYDALPKEARDLYQRMTTNYRNSHNAAKRKLAENIIDSLDLKLKPADRTGLIEKVVNGTLVEADKPLVGPTVYRALKNAAALRAIKGDYFPQMRFGNHVVVTTEKVDDPTLDHLVVAGQRVPVTTEVTGNLVRFTADQSTRGVAAELDRQVSDWVAQQSLKVMRVSKRWRDRKTGGIVEKGDQIVGRDYDLTYEAELQTKGVHYFESAREARKFAKKSTSYKVSPVLERRAEQAANVALEGTDVSAILKRIDARTDMSASERKVMKRALEEAVVASMPGNRSPARYQARRNVAGASRDIGRAAATYGTSQGNFMATLETAPKTREAMKGLGEIESNVFDKNAGAVSQVMAELRRRVEGIENPDEPNQLAQTISTISFFDKLASPAASVVNAMQVAMNAGPYLGGRYGNVAASAAIVSAYNRIGTVGTIARGVGAAAKSIALWRRSSIDTSNILGSVRKKLGKKYDDLLNELISRGALDENAGFEIAQAVIESKGVVRKNIARFDRAVRQLPNAVEVVNRAVTSVAAYDLAKKAGRSDADAIQEAFDVVMMTQGDYRPVNTPRFMKQGLLSFAMQFRKYALLQTQLYADMYARIMKGATAKEKAIAAKQLGNLMTMQVLMAGAVGLPGLEVIKAGVTLLGMLGLSEDDWEDWQRNAQDVLAQAVGKDWANLIANGVVSRAAGIDVSARMSQADLWTGFAPESMDVKGITQYAGGLFLGAPGQTVLDWFVGAPQKLKDGDVVGALELWVPVKTLADSVKAYKKYQEGEYDMRDAILQGFGFKSAQRADKDAQSDRAWDEKDDLRKEADRLRKAFLDAGNNADVAKVKSQIREYNRKKKPEGIGNINIDRLVEKRRKGDADD